MSKHFWRVRQVIFTGMLLMLLPGCAPRPDALASQPVITSTPVEAIGAAVPLSSAEASPTETPAKVAETSSATPLPSLTINPLTGLRVADPALLDRRPVLVKVENLPRIHRPPFGLNQADITYEYVTEEGTTRFAALFYGQQVEKIGPIRSARWFDVRLINMYEPIFVYGSAYQKLTDFLLNQPFSSRLILEGPNTSPALYRHDKQVHNTLMLNMFDLENIIDQYRIDNTRPPLEGMTFSLETPEEAEHINTIYTRFSGAIYNRWDYDTERNVYLRSIDNADDLSGNNEVYTAHLDALNGDQIYADNLVVIIAPYREVDGPNIYDIDFNGSGDAYLFRDGVVQKGTWHIDEPDGVLALLDAEGKPLDFKPGKTWFEMMNVGSAVKQVDETTLRFVFFID